MSGFAEKLNVENSVNSTGNCLHQMYGMFGFAKILNIKNFVNSSRNLYIIYVWNVWICRKIEYPELWKFNGKLCTLYIYGISGFAEKLNVQNYGNSTGNYVHYSYGMSGFAETFNVQTAEIQQEIVYNICTECLDLQKN